MANALASNAIEVTGLRPPSVVFQRVISRIVIFSDTGGREMVCVMALHEFTPVITGQNCLVTIGGPR